MKITTDRLTLEPHTFDSIEPLYKWMNDEELVKLEYAGGFKPLSKVEVMKILTRYIEHTESGKAVHWAIRLKETGEMIGYCGLIRVNRIHKSCTTYIVIGEREHWGKGFGKELLKTRMDYVFGTMGLNRIESAAFSNNQRSLRMVLAVGFKVEGIKVQSKIIDGVFVDEYMVAALREDWEKAKLKS